MNEQMKNHVVNLYLIALSDGQFSPEELDVILKIGEEKGFSKEEFEQIVIQPGVEFSCPDNFMERIYLLYDFTKVILADGKIDQSEEATFLRFCKKFGFEEQGKELFDWLIKLAKQDLSKQDLDTEIQKLIN